MASDFEKLHMQYRDLAKKAQGGDKQAHADKARVMNEIVAIRRDAARAGTILNATYRGDKVVVTSEEGRSKRSRQEEYIDKFDGEITAMLPDLDVKDVEPKKRPLKEQTARAYNRKRLLGK